MNNHELAEYAQKYKACKPGLKQILSSANEAELIELYKKNIDFCLSENFPSNEYLAQVDADVLGVAGIYIDENIVSNNSDFLVLLGGCKAGITAMGYDVLQLFVKHNSVVNIEAKDNAYAVIDCFDDSSLDIEAKGNAKVLINVYGNAIVSYQHDDTSQVKIILKHKKGY